MSVKGDSKTPASARRMFNSASLPILLSTVHPLPFVPWMNLNGTAPETALAESLNGRVRDAIMFKWHPLHTSHYVWIKTVLLNLILRYGGDNIDMAHNIESRVAFLDHRLTEYVNGLPPSLKMKYNPQERDFQEKHVLREAVKPFVTEEIYHRRKQPFLGPTRFAEDGSLHQKLKSLLTRDNVEALGFLDWDGVSTCLDKAFREKDPVSLRPAFLAAQFVVLSQRFRVPRAQPAATRC